ncbi:DUF4422 domain-containing protein [Campylobacter sp. MIT 12-5580]|uniref:DUF4422 domain-containing protein n=1 Tax=Campylobacter sp. MIT 12-5580 TaxID=2040651 RepID=UPI0024B50933|nr:DUF4422 domain-containing protein [Campylobacter sp. MIT 12-5580]
MLVGYHKPAVLLKDEILTPIHLGRALATQSSKDGEMSKEDYEWMCENMIGDDTGENISHLNRYFCELTGIYWAWKNYDKLGNPGYIGFMHYRRHFIFAEGEKEFSSEYSLNFDFPDKDYISAIGLKPSIIHGVIAGCDLVHPTLYKYEKSVYEQFKDLEDSHYCMDFSIWDKSIQILHQEYPDYSDALNEYLKSNYHIWFNSFIMTRQLFFEYCEFIFKIIFKIYQQINLDNQLMSFQSQRILAFIAERFFGVFVTKHKNELKIKKYPLSQIHNTNIYRQVTPAFQKNNIPIVFSIDSNYINYLGVCIYSIIKNSSPSYCYDICILHSNLNKDTRSKISFLKQDNVSIRFIDISEFAHNQQFYTGDSHFSEATYYRFFVPSLFSAYEKLIYLDCDMIVLKDISKLYETDITNYVFAATKEIGMSYYLNLYKNKKDDFYLNFVQTKMQMKNPLNYFQAGLLLYNIPECIKQNFVQKCLECLKRLKNPPTVDQDVFNAVFEGKVKFLSLKWNCAWHVKVLRENCDNVLPHNTLLEYNEALNDPYIIHYCDSVKPWSHPHLLKADIWWHYARQTPFYEEILFYNVRGGKPCGAVERVKSQLSYKLGYAMINSKNIIKIILLPFVLIGLAFQYKKDRARYESLIRVNHNLKLPKLDDYKDYKESLKVKKHLSYMLGNALIKNPFTFLFKIRRIINDFNKNKEAVDE